MPTVQKEVERFVLRKSERQLLEIAIRNLEQSRSEAEALYHMRTGAILVDHGMDPDSTGRFVQVDGKDIAFIEVVEEEVPEETSDAPAETTQPTEETTPTE